MSGPDRDPLVEPGILRVSDTLVEKLADKQTIWGRLRKGELWLLIDASRWGIVASLALSVFAMTLLVGKLGLYTVQQFLLDGTSIANSYVGIVGIIHSYRHVDKPVDSPRKVRSTKPSRPTT